MDDWLVRRRGIESMRMTEEEVLANHRRWFGERAFSVINGKYAVGSRLNQEGRYNEALDPLSRSWFSGLNDTDQTIEGPVR